MKPVIKEKRDDLFKGHVRWNDTLRYLIETLGAFDGSKKGYTFGVDHIIELCERISHFNSKILPEVLFVMKIAVDEILKERVAYSTKYPRKDPHGNLSSNVYSSKNLGTSNRQFVYHNKSFKDVKVHVEYCDNIRSVALVLCVRNRALKKYPNKVQNDYVEYYPKIHSGQKGWCELVEFRTYYKEKDDIDMIHVLTLLRNVVHSVTAEFLLPGASTYKNLGTEGAAAMYSREPILTRTPSMIRFDDCSVLTQVHEMMKGNIEEALFNLTLLSSNTEEMFDAAIALLALPANVLNPVTNENDLQLDIPVGYRLRTNVNLVILFCDAYMNEIAEMSRVLKG